MQIMDKDSVLKDDYVGVAKISLLPVWYLSYPPGSTALCGRNYDVAWF